MQTIKLSKLKILLFEEEKMWFENEVLIGDGTLMLHSNEIGDTVGIVKKVSNVQYVS